MTEIRKYLYSLDFRVLVALEASWKRFRNSLEKIGIL